MAADNTLPLVGQNELDFDSLSLSEFLGDDVCDCLTLNQMEVIDQVRVGVVPSFVYLVLAS